MKRKLVILCIYILTLAIGSFIGLHIWIGGDVKKNIEIVKKQYSGSAEEALISFLKDENNSFNDRTHKAIWTLGQIRSKKALPLLKELYKNDPKGETCKGYHDSELCQYELSKAIVAVEKGWLFSQARHNK